MIGSTAVAKNNDSNTMDIKMREYLECTLYFNYDHPLVQEFMTPYINKSWDSKDLIVHAYYKVRDEIKYNPYTFSTDPSTFSASKALETGESYCIPKAVLLGSIARAFNIPSRLGLADVRNHIAPDGFTEKLGSNYFAMHGYIDLHINGKWVKATPAFNKELCEKLNTDPLEFNGEEDSVFQQYNKSGNQYMSYEVDHGTFADVPVQFIMDGVAKHYPHLKFDK